MLQGKPLNNFVTLQGKIRIIVDNEIKSTHDGNLIEWRHKKNLRVKIERNTTSINDSSLEKSDSIREIVLSLRARDEGVTKENKPFLHLFYYRDDKTENKEIKKHVLKLRQDVMR